jgi:hypothetical protein
MDDLISRQNAIDVLRIEEELLRRVLDDMDVVGQDREKYSWGLGLIESYISDIEELPSAEPVRHGKWEPCCEWHGTNGEVETRAYACSECAVIIPTDSYDVRFLRGCFLRYCPHCGARMDKDE